MSEDEKNQEIQESSSSNLILEKEQFRPILRQAIETDTNFLTIGGLANLAHNIQNELYKTDSLTKGDFGKRISSSRVELAARVPATVLDRTSVDLSYEVGNISAWLKQKGISVKLNGPRIINWSGGEGKVQAGRAETKVWYADEDFTPGGLVIITEYLSLKLSELTALSEKSEDKRLLGFAASLAGVVSEETRCIAEKGKPLDADTVESMLKTPLAEVGIEIRR